MTYKLPVSRSLTRLAILTGIPFLLVKPHYGILPVLMLAHRLWRQKRLSVVFDFDFLGLSAGVLVYAAVILIRFPDFISDVLTDMSIRLYATEPIAMVYPVSLGLAVCAGSMVILGFLADKKEGKPLILVLSAMALVAVIPFFIQLKGFSLHMLPVLALLLPASGGVLSLYMNYTDGRGTLYSMLAVPVLFIAGYSYNIDRRVTQETFRSSPLANYIQAHAADSGFLIQSTSTNITVPISVYTGIPQASRFSSLWFVSPLNDKRNADLIPRFSGLVAEDLESYQPDFVALYHNPQPGDDFIQTFQGQPEFDRAWSAYRLEGEMELDYGAFYKGAPYYDTPYTRYDVYVRKSVNR